MDAGALDAKQANLAGAINELHAGKGPELLGVAEVEGDDVFEQLLAATGNSHLKVVKDPNGTSDLRGIDVSLAYDDRKLTVVDKQSHVVHLRYATRDIYEVEFELRDTHERFVVIASHWPSRRRGRWRSEPFRVAVAENIGFIVRDHVRVDANAYEELRAKDDLKPVQDAWETPILIVGDFNDEPPDRSVVEHLQASSELDRVIGPTNDITAFEKDTARYRNDDIWLYNASWKFLEPEDLGTFFISSTPDEAFANRYQVLDQIVASRGLLTEGGVRLDVELRRHPSDRHRRDQDGPAAWLRSQVEEGNVRPPSRHSGSHELARAAPRAPRSPMRRTCAPDPDPPRRPTRRCDPDRRVRQRLGR